MSLSKAKSLISDSGKLIAEYAISYSGSEEPEFLFEAIAGLAIAKNAVTRQINAHAATKHTGEEIRQTDGPVPDGTNTTVS